MRLLFDQNLSFRLCQRLDDLFPDSTQARLLRLDGADDRTLWDFARENGFAIVSLDSDFSDLAALHGPPPKVIWLRCGNQRTEKIESLLRDHFEIIAAFERDPAACLEVYGYG